MKKDLKALVKRAEARGWRVTPTSNGHLQFRDDHGNTVYAASTPSDYRALLNIRARLRRAERRR